MFRTAAETWKDLMIGLRRFRIAGKITTADDYLWVVSYDGLNRPVTITAPKVSVGATTREGLTVSRAPGADPYETRVKVANLDSLTVSAEWDRRVTFDGKARWTADYAARGATTGSSTTNSLERTAVWHSDKDLMLSSRANGRMTTFIYDSHDWLTATYGPALPACFDASREPLNATCRNEMPVTLTEYDTTLTAGGASTPMKGLAQSAWPNTTFTGRPVSTTFMNDPNSVAWSWGSGAPPNVANPDGWSVRWTGEVNLDATGAWGFWLSLGSTADTAALYIDDKLVVAGSGAAGTTVYYGVIPGTTTAGYHRIRLDYTNVTGNGFVQLNWNKPGVGNQVVPVANARPLFGLATRTTVESGSANAPSNVTHTRYDEGVSPALGLVTSTIQDPGGLNLKTTYTYDSYRRTATKQLPGGTITSYQYWGNTETTSATISCADGTSITSGVNQGGLPKGSTVNSWGAPTTVRSEVVYDAAGRPVASRANSDPWTCMAYDTRGRPVKTAYPANASAPARTVTPFGAGHTWTSMGGC